MDQSDEDGMTKTALTRTTLRVGARSIPVGLLGLALLSIWLAPVALTGCQSPMSPETAPAGDDMPGEGTAGGSETGRAAQTNDSTADDTSDPYVAELPPEPGMPAPRSTPGQTSRATPGSASTSSADEPVDLADRFRELEATERVSQEERAAVVEALLEQARADLSSADHKNALVKVNEALTLLPGHRPALQLRHDIWRAMGTDESYLSIADQLESETRVQRDQLRMEAIAHYNAGREAYDEERYDEARESLRRFLDVVEWSAFDLELDDLREPARQLMQLADRRSGEEAARAEDDRRREARDRVLTEERRQARMRVRKIRELFEEGVREFQDRRFDRSERIAREILRLNPGDRNAERLRDQSIMLRHRDAEDDIVAEKIQRWQDFLTDMQEARNPYPEIIEFPDREVWEDLSTRRLQETAFDDGGTEDSPAVQAIKSRLANARVTLQFEDAPLPEVLEFIKDIADVNIVLDPEVAEAFESEGTLITLPVEDLQLSAALDILFNMHNLKGAYKDDVLFVTRSDKIVGETVLRLHDIKDLTTTLTDFPGADIQLVEASGDEFGGGAIFGGDEATPTFDADSIVELITTSIAPETWDEDPARFSIQPSGGNLIIRHTPQVHAEVNRFLSDLRAFAGILVTVETRFLEVSDWFLESIGVDIRGLGDSLGGGLGAAQNNSTFATMDLLPADGQIGGSGVVGAGAGLFHRPGGLLDNQGRGRALSSGFFFQDQNQDVRGRTENLWDRPLGDVDKQNEAGGLLLQWTLLDDAEYSFLIQAVSKSTQATTLTAPKLTAFNTQRANITIANQVSYISDFDVEVAQTSQIADPIVSVIQDGLVLDVRPTVSYDLKYITLEVKPTVALLTRPIGTITTSLGAGGQVTIQLPELEVSSAATTVKIPDGGSMLLGGLKTARSEDRVSTTPGIDHIPVLSFFFRKKGRVEELDNLLILIRGTITDLSEAERNFTRGF